MSGSSEKVTEAATAAGACGGATAVEPGEKPKKSIKPKKRVQIPLADWKQACSQVKKFEEDPLSDEEQKLEQCPYDKCHRVPSAKFTVHFHKCRENYRQMKLAKGEQVLMLACKYNYQHLMAAPELLFHLERCKDRHEVPFYLLQTDGEGGLDESKIPKEQLVKMWEGKLVDQFIGSDYATGVPIPLENIRHRNAIKKKMKAIELSQSKAEKLAEPKQGPSSSLKGAAMGEGSAGTSSASSQAEASEDGIDWENNTGGTWYLTDGDYNPSRPRQDPVYPIGLNREQRREFVKWNNKWMEEIMARDREAKAEDDGE